MSTRLQRSLNDSNPSFVHPRTSDLQFRPSEQCKPSSQKEHNLLGNGNAEEILEEPQAEPQHTSKTREMVQRFKMEVQNDFQKPFQKKSIIPASEYGESQFQSAYKRQPSNLSDDQDEDAQIEDSRCIMRQESRARISWDIFVIILALWNVFFIPLNIAFKPPFGEFLMIMLFNYLIDFLFFMDIVLNFRTTYLDSDGDQIFLPKMIAVHYIKSGRLFIDLLASIPLDSIPGLTFLEFLGLLKLMRIFRVPKLIQKVSLTETAKTSIKVLEVILLLVILYHITACIWFIVVDGTNEWIPPVYWIDFADLGRAFYLDFRTSLQQQYLLCLYYGVMGLNSASLIMFSGMFINALLFGTMAQLILQLKRKERQVQESLDLANTAMMNLKLPMRNQREVVQYLMTIQSTQAQQEQLKNFQTLISPPLKKEVRIHIFHKMIVRNVVFKVLIDRPQIESNDFVYEAVKWLDIKLSEPENEIFAYNSPADAIYFIAKGAVVIENKDMVKRKHEPYDVLKQSNHFGEIGVIYNCPRTMRVTGQRYSTLAKLSGQKMIEMSQMYPTMVDQFKNHIKTYQDPVKVTLEKVLPRVPIFKHLGQFELHKIIFSFQMISVAPKDMLFEYGGPQEGMYVILDGYATLSLRTEGIHMPVKLLRRGHIYGVDSLLVPDKHRLSLMCMNYKLSRSKAKKRDKNGGYMSNQQLYDEQGNVIALNRSIFASPNQSSPNQSRKTSSSMIANSQKYPHRVLPMHVPGLAQIEEEGLSPDQERHRVGQSSYMNISPRVQEKSSIRNNGSASLLMNSMDGVNSHSQPNRKASIYYTRRVANTAVAFLSNEAFQSLVESIPQLSSNVESEMKQIEKSSIRPYLMDYYIPKKMPKTRNLLAKMKFITERQGGRNALFKFKNAVFHKLFTDRAVKKSQTIIERVFCQINKEELEKNTSYLDLSENFDRSRSLLLTPSFRFGRSMTEEAKMQTFVNDTHEMHSMVNIILSRMDDMNKRIQGIKNGFDFTLKVVLEVLGIAPQMFDALALENSYAHDGGGGRYPDVINEYEEIISKEKSLESGNYEMRKKVDIGEKDDDIESQPPEH